MTPRLAPPLSQPGMPCMTRAMGALACLLAAGSIGAQTPDTASTPDTKVYKYLNGGIASFSDVPPRRGAYIVWSPSCYACNLNSTINWHATKLHTQAYGEAIDAAAKAHDLDPALVRAVIHAESGFNPKARSHKGAVGLMQLMPATAREVGVRDARVPSHNIRGGTQYLASLLAQFRGDVTLAAAAYNAGPAAVAKYAGIPPYAETQVYVQRVKILHRRYREQPQG
ncbi:MAG: lytic transglycosylase domain-containing protein [Rhodoferax sp.]|nr:lytic transglycosylase domain-containing protein [Rhodoferax sp.]